MKIPTTCDDRRVLVQKISEHLDTPAIYLRTPTYAYQIGAVTVERDCSITGADEVLAHLIPFLRDEGYTDMPDADSIPEEVKMKLEEYTTNTEAPNDNTAIQVNIPPLTVPQMINLLRLVCSKQHLIQKMLQSDTLYVERDFVETLSKNPPATSEDFTDEVQRGSEEGFVRGISITEHSARMTIAHVEENSPRWMASSLLLLRMAEHARKATRVQLAVEDPENEKYSARALLLRLGFGGADNREARSVLLDHLHGYAAFKDEAGMQAHREKQAAKRKAAKEESETDD